MGGTAGLKTEREKRAIQKETGKRKVTVVTFPSKSISVKTSHGTGTAREGGRGRKQRDEKRKEERKTDIQIQKRTNLCLVSAKRVTEK